MTQMVSHMTYIWEILVPSVDMYIDDDDVKESDSYNGHGVGGECDLT